MAITKYKKLCTILQKLRFIIKFYLILLTVLNNVEIGNGTSCILEGYNISKLSA